MVPRNWKHPLDDRGHLQAMYRGNFADKFREWLAEFDRIRSGDLTDIERECYAEPGMNPLAEWLRDEGMPIDPKQYQTWRDEDATWVQVWETVSEGTPVSPPFATKEELIDYLVQGGDDWDRKRGRGGYTRAQATAFVNSGWVPSMIIQGGVSSVGIECAEAMRKS
jgi:hypothetical protein